MAMFASDEALCCEFRSDLSGVLILWYDGGFHSGGEQLLKMISFVKLQEMVVVFEINLRNNGAQ
jgi:hypothetical protein